MASAVGCFGLLWLMTLVFAPESHTSNVPLSALGKCLERLPSRVSSGQNIGVSPSREDPRRAELGVKRTHSDGKMAAVP